MQFAFQNAGMQGPKSSREVFGNFDVVSDSQCLWWNEPELQVDFIQPITVACFLHFPAVSPISSCDFAASLGSLKHHSSAHLVLVAPASSADAARHAGFSDRAVVEEEGSAHHVSLSAQ